MATPSRVSTAGSYSAILANLQAAQQRQQLYGQQVSSQKLGQNLKDYAKQADTLTSLRSVQTRVQVYQEQNTAIADKLAAQDSGLNQVADATQAARQAIADALASGSGGTLMVEMRAQFANVVEGLNSRHNGKYLFAGGQIDTKPVTATQMSDLTAGPPIASFFQNDDFVTKAKLDDATTIDTGYLADGIGTPLLTLFQQMQAFDEGAGGPFATQLTAAQVTFLQGQLASWDTARAGVTNTAAQNGLNQNRVAQVGERLQQRGDGLESMLGDLVNVDLSEAISRLQQAQLSVQAAAQVFSTLQSTSLLNLLSGR